METYRQHISAYRQHVAEHDPLYADYTSLGGNQPIFLGIISHFNCLFAYIIFLKIHFKNK